MREEYPIKEKDYERIMKDFRSIRFPCIKYGSMFIDLSRFDTDYNLE